MPSENLGGMCSVLLSIDIEGFDVELIITSEY